MLQDLQHLLQEILSNRSSLQYQRYGSAYQILHLSASECLTSFACRTPTMPSADFSHEVRIDYSTLSPDISGTHERSPGVRH